MAYAAGTPWLPRTIDAKVVEPVERTLGKLFAEGPLPMEEARHLGESIAAAVARCHASGTIIGDLTPDRIRLVARDGNDEAEIIEPDRMATKGPSEAPPARYMAPEQVQSHAVTAAADIYTLGVILFEMLAGHAPVEGRTPMEQMVRKTIADAMPLREACPGVSPSFAVLVDACLSRQPERRPRSAAEVAARVREDARPRATVELSNHPRRGGTAVVAARPGGARTGAQIAALVAALGVAVAAVAYAFMDEDAASPWGERVRGNVMAPLEPAP